MPSSSPDAVVGSIMTEPRPSFQWLAWRPSPKVTPLANSSEPEDAPVSDRYLAVLDAVKTIAPSAALALE